MKLSVKHYVGDLLIQKGNRPVRIMLVGPPGVGKSSFINYVFALLSGKPNKPVEQKATVAEKRGHVTLKTQVYDIKLGDRALQLIDTRGFDDGYSDDEFRALLRGEWPDGASLEDFRNLPPAEIEELKQTAAERQPDAVLMFALASSVVGNAEGQSGAQKVMADVLSRMLDLVMSAEHRVYGIVTQANLEASVPHLADHRHLSTPAAQNEIKILKEGMSKHVGVSQQSVYVSNTHTKDIDSQTPPELDRQVYEPLAAVMQVSLAETGKKPSKAHQSQQTRPQKSSNYEL